MSFEKNILDSLSSVSTDFTSNNGRLLIIFGGIGGNMGMPPFEFSRLLSSVDANKIFIRDVSQSWYQNGIPDVCESFDGLVQWLKFQILQQNPDKVVVIGNSAGGYASLLAGNLLAVDNVLAFSPQTFLSKLLRYRYADFRWRQQIDTIYRNDSCNREYLDLKKVFMENKYLNARSTIYYCTNHRLDKIHAERMNVFQNISLSGHSFGGHALVKTLRDNGELKRIILESLV